MQLTDLSGKVAVVTGASSGIAAAAARALVAEGVQVVLAARPQEEMKARRDKLEALHPEDIAHALVYAFVHRPTSTPMRS
jgi:NADP-dependent 3-hydroxy acid dehydrogenase YdfG